MQDSSASMTPCHEPCSSDEECEETFNDNHGVDAAESDERSGLGGRAVNTGTTGLAVERDKDVLLECDLFGSVRYLVTIRICPCQDQFS